MSGQGKICLQNVQMFLQGRHFPGCGSRRRSNCYCRYVVLAVLVQHDLNKTGVRRAMRAKRVGTGRVSRLVLSLARCRRLGPHLTLSFGLLRCMQTATSPTLNHMVSSHFICPPFTLLLSLVLDAVNWDRSHPALLPTGGPLVFLLSLRTPSLRAIPIIPDFPAVPTSLPFLAPARAIAQARSYRFPPDCSS